jgi:glycosyltransferase involved in cell wall biosynthesis
VKIAVVQNLPSGGARRALVEHCRGLRARGHTVEAFYPDTADEAFLPLEPVVDRVHVWRAPPPPAREASLFGKVGPGAAFRAARLVRALIRIHREMATAVDRGGFDVALVGHDMFTHAPRALRYLRTPSAYYCQEPLRFVYEAPVGIAVRSGGGFLARTLRTAATAAAKRVLKPMDARSVRAARMILANSVYSHESILRAYGRSARVVYLGVDAAHFRPLDVPRERIVLSVGAMHPAKGFDFVIASLARIPETRRPALVIVSDRGYGVYRGLLEAQARSAGVRLRIEERASEDELVRWYNRAAVLAYAPYLEPFGLVALEAMACGTPVVAVAEGGTRESVRAGETGLLTPREAGAFAEALDRVLSDVALGSGLAAAARADVAQRWTWGESARQLEEALGECRDGAT